MRVAQILSGERIWGVERYLLNLIDALPTDVDILAVCLNSGELLSELKTRACRTEYLPVKGYADALAVIALFRLLKEWQPQIIHTHLGLDSWIGTAAGAMLDIPVITSVHFDNPAYTKRPIYQRLPWQTAQRIKNLFVAHFLPITEISALSLQQRESVPQNRVTVIHPGIHEFAALKPEQRAEYRRQFNFSDNEVVLVSVGRLDFPKGMDRLIHAVAALPISLKSRTKLVIAGDGPELSELKRLIIQLGLSQQVELLGYCNDVRALLLASDIFVLCPRWEAFGMAAVEAMMAGLPVIASSGTGLATIVEDQVTGLLTETGNVDKLANSIMTLILDHERRIGYGIAGRERAMNKFSSNSMADSVMAIYERMS